MSLSYTQYIPFLFPFLKKPNSRKESLFPSLQSHSKLLYIKPLQQLAFSQRFLFFILFWILHRKQRFHQFIIIHKDDAQSPKPRRLGASLDRESPNHSLATQNPNPIPASNPNPKPNPLHQSKPLISQNPIRSSQIHGHVKP